MANTIYVELTPAQLQAVVALIGTRVSVNEMGGVEDPDLAAAEFQLDSALLAWEENDARR